jgi:hypothetical protein
MTSRFLAALAFAALLSGLPAAGQAQQAMSQLQLSVAHELPRYAPGVDVMSLSTGQLAALHAVLYSDRTESDIRAQVGSILGGLDVLLFGRQLSLN